MKTFEYTSKSGKNYFLQPEANLRFADLSGLDLSLVDLNRANLYGSDLCGTNLTNANLTKTNLTRARRNSSDPTIQGWQVQNGVLVRK